MPKTDVTRRTQNVSLNLDENEEIIHLSAGVSHLTSVRGMDFERGDRFSLRAEALTPEETEAIKTALAAVNDALGREYPIDQVGKTDQPA